MRLRRLFFENYKAFVAPDELELRPLSIVFGYNSSGKSALVRLLPSIAALVGGRRRNFREEPAAEFSEMVSALSSNPLMLGLEWVSPQDKRFVVRFHIRPIVVWKLRTHVIERIELLDEEREEFLEFVWTPEPGSSQPTTQAARYEIQLPGSPRERVGVAELSISGLSIQAKIRTVFDVGRLQAISAATKTASDLLESLRDDVMWLRANRAVPEQVVTPLPTDHLSPDGSEAANILAWDTLSSTGKLVSDVSGWYQKTTGYMLNADPVVVGQSDMCSLSLSPLQGSAVKIPLRNTGEGMAHVLPVLTLIALGANAGSSDIPVCCVEHPELHLHSRAHAGLASHFCDAIKRSEPPTFVIETHSESFLLEIQLAILRGDLSPDDVILHWVRQEPDGTSWIDHIEFDELAKTKDGKWPSGLFEEAYQQAQEILALREDRRAKG